MKHLLVVISLSLTFTALSQEYFNLHGEIKDSLKIVPIEYVNIGLFEQNIGTVSNENGKFSLDIPMCYLNDSLAFSRIGYTTKKVCINELMGKSVNLIQLVPKTSELKEVEIKTKEIVLKSKGNKTTSKQIVLGVSSALSLGKETGCVTRLPNKQIVLTDFNFNIVFNRPDSAKFRLNIYEYSGEIGENILSENVYFTIPTNFTGKFNVDLRKYNIKVENDIFASIEVIAVYSNGPDPNKEHDEYYYDRINISGTLTGSKSYNREVSLGKWEKTELSFSPGFWFQYFLNE